LKRETKIPVTVITGFLGAGKTTFINDLLKRNSDTVFALVENEFGEIAIDTKLIRGVDASAMFELKEGCICCSLTDEYELVLQELAERFSTVNHLLIETTGIADPAPIIQPFFSDENLKEIYHFNGTVCLVDALHFEELQEKEISLKQITLADQLLVNKSENLRETEKEALKKELGSLNPFAEIRFTEYGNSAEIKLDKIIRKIRSSFDFVRFSHPHINIESKLIELDKKMTKADFLHWFSYLLDINRNLIYRTKGILYFADEPFEYILQGVGGNFELTEGDLLIEPGESKIVLIGKLGNLIL